MARRVAGGRRRGSGVMWRLTPGAIRSARPGVAVRLAVVAALVGGAVAVPVAGGAAGGGDGAPRSPLALFNGTVSATAVHVQAGSSAFPNIASGAIDNRYPLAHARLESSPFALATASPADTGPLGQTLAAEAQQTQPQYATVRCPPTCEEPATTGTPPGPAARAEAAARQAEASAVAAETSLGGDATGAAQPAPARPAPDDLIGEPNVPAAPTPPVTAPPVPSPPAPSEPAPGAPVPSQPAPTVPKVTLLALREVADAATGGVLRSRLATWRQRYLTAGDAARYPLPVAAPDSVSGSSATGRAEARHGTLVLTGESALARAVLAGGQVVLRDVRVRVVLTNDGTPERDVTVEVGSAEVGGVPVRIGPDGVSVHESRIPGLAGAARQANAALNQTLADSGVEVRTLQPLVRRSDHQEELDAVAVHVRFAHPPLAPGVPAQFMTVALGEVFAGSLAVPGGVTIAGRNAGPAATPLPSGAGTIPGTSSPPAIPDGGAYDIYESRSGAAASDRPIAGSEPRSWSTERIVNRDRPVEILVLYGVAQVLALASALALWAWRREATP